MPEILENVNEIDMGCRQDGTPLRNVVLPNWAKDAHDFVRQHREVMRHKGGGVITLLGMYMLHMRFILSGFGERIRQQASTSLGGPRLRLQTATDAHYRWQRERHQRAYSNGLPHLNEMQ